MESDNVVDKYAVCVKKNDVIVEYLPHDKTEDSLRWDFISSEQINMCNAKLK